MERGPLPLRSGIVVALFFALFVATAGALRVRAAAEQDFALPPPVAPRIAVPRCYALAFRLATAAKEGALPPAAVRLSGRRDSASVPPPWFLAVRVGRDSLAPAYWAAAGPDSLDVIFPGWPTGLRIRIPSAEDTVAGRVRVTTDAMSDWAETGAVRAIRIPCVGPSEDVRFLLQP